MSKNQLKTLAAIWTDSRYEHLADVNLVALIANAIGATFTEVEAFTCQLKR